MEINFSIFISEGKRCSTLWRFWNLNSIFISDLYKLFKNILFLDKVIFFCFYLVFFWCIYPIFNLAWHINSYLYRIKWFLKNWCLRCVFSWWEVQRSYSLIWDLPMNTRFFNPFSLIIINTISYSIKFKNIRLIV